MARPAHHLAAAVILLAAFLLQLHHLNHAAIKPLDEVFHAIVARHLMLHPLLPTLVEHPWLPYDVGNWQANHVWLHKPPMALWTIALSFKLLGVNPLALRLPSAILAVAAATLTYLIGCRLLNPTAGLIAAALQAFNAPIWMLVHGYLFSDAVDISLLFWTELAIYLLLRASASNRRLDLLLCGTAQGLAFLSKTWPALIVTGLALVLWLLPVTPLARREQTRITGRSILWLLLGAAAIALPWMCYTAIRFPEEFAAENLRILSHLNQDIEGWAGPWDRVLFDYWISIFYVFYPAALAAFLLLLATAIRTRDLRLWFVLLWALGVLLPHLAATSKTMSATLIGWPAMWLLLGYLISLAISGVPWAAAAWGVAAVCALLVRGSAIPTSGWGYGPGGFGSIMLQHPWVLEQTAGVLLAAAFIRWIDPSPTSARATAIACIATALSAIPLFRWWHDSRARGYIPEAWAVTNINADNPNYATLAAFAARLPPNAAFIVDENTKLENKLIEFATDRSCYPTEPGGDWQLTGERLAKAGALPYLITNHPESLPILLADRTIGQAVFSCNLQATRAGQAAMQQ